jgi:hypothetical protein
LQSLPKVTDRQNPSDLFRKINARIQDEQINHSRKKTWLLPSVASVAALFLIFLIGSQLVNLSGGMHESANDHSATEESAESLEDEAGLFKAEGDAEINATGITESGQNDTMMRMDTGMTSDILIQEEAANGTLITIGIPDTLTQNFIPVSMLSSDNSLSRLDAIQEAFQNISEEELGLNQHFFDEVQLKEEGDKLVITVPEGFNGNLYTGNSLEIAIDETFRWMGYKEVELKTAEGNPVEVGNYGPMPIIQLDETLNKGYFVYNTPAGHVYLVPSPKEYQSATFQEALDFMKKRIDTHALESSIPTEFEVIANVQGDHATVTFNSAGIEDNETTSLMIKAILLTAREFGIKEVTFDGTPEQLGGILLRENGEPISVKVPVAPNHIPFPTK